MSFFSRLSPLGFFSRFYGIVNPTKVHFKEKRNFSSCSYVCTKVGTVFELNYELMVIHKVRRLLPTGSRQDLVGEHSSPSVQYGIAINCLSVHEAFCVTGSDDGYLRLWPLDFSGVILEAGMQVVS